MELRTGDEVKVISGKDKGKESIYHVSDEGEGIEAESILDLPRAHRSSPAATVLSWPRAERLRHPGHRGPGPGL